MRRFRTVFLLAATLLLLLLPACGGYQTLSSITARDEISGQSFTAKMLVRRGEVGGSYTSFVSSKPLDDLKEGLLARTGNVENMQAAVYQGQYVLFTQQAGGETAFFLLARVPNAEGDEQPRYALLAPVACFGERDAGDGKSLIYFPYHLLENTEIQMYPGQTALPDGAAFPTAAEINAFEAFYRALADCGVSREGNVLRVKHMQSGRTVQIAFYEEQGVKMARFSICL